MGSFEFAVESLLSISPAQWCQAYYVLSSIIIVSIQVLPADLRTALLDYGARQQNSTRKSRIAWLLDCLQVPHSWFLHFYILSLGLSAFWGWQYYTRGWVLTEIAQAQVKGSGNGLSMDISQVRVAWGLMGLQGGRRLYESLFILRAGKSPMSSIHWLVGLSFYAAMSISIWIEGSGKTPTWPEFFPSNLHL